MVLVELVAACGGGEDEDGVGGDGGRGAGLG